jgi:hypothetical protein
MVISQVYGGGGTPGAAFKNSFIELFNRGTTAVDLNHWSLRFASAAGTFNLSITFVSSGSIPIQPGQYVLLQLGSAGANGALVPGDFQAPLDLGLSGKIALTKPNASLPAACPSPNSDLADFVGYGDAANCFEGSGPSGAQSNTTAAIRRVDGCIDTNNNSSDFLVSSPTPRNSNSPIHICPNSIDDAEFFVRQHYTDFLNRQADPSGLAFWTNEITSCGTNAQCIEIKRINVSAAFFLSIEFQETGYLVYRFYKASYGDAIGTSTNGGAHQLAVPVVRRGEFLPDTQQIGQGVQVGIGNWQQQLEANKQTFAAQFVERPRFSSAFPTSLTPTQFVNMLFVNAGVTPTATEQQDTIDEFGGAGNTTDTTARARVLRRIAENSTLARQEFNKAFVLMQYFGYLQRNPNDAPEPGLNYSGYDFWLTKLNQFNGNFVEAEMVKAFIMSGEYRQRFGP